MGLGSHRSPRSGPRCGPNPPDTSIGPLDRHAGASSPCRTLTPTATCRAAAPCPVEEPFPAVTGTRLAHGDAKMRRVAHICGGVAHICDGGQMPLRTGGMPRSIAAPDRAPPGRPRLSDGLRSNRSAPDIRRHPPACRHRLPLFDFCQTPGSSLFPLPDPLPPPISAPRSSPPVATPGCHARLRHPAALLLRSPLLGSPLSLPSPAPRFRLLSLLPRHPPRLHRPREHGFPP